MAKDWKPPVTKNQTRATASIRYTESTLDQLAQGGKQQSQANFKGPQIGEEHMQAAGGLLSRWPMLYQSLTQRTPV